MLPRRRGLVRHTPQTIVLAAQAPAAPPTCPGRRLSSRRRRQSLHGLRRVHPAPPPAHDAIGRPLFSVSLQHHQQVRRRRSYHQTPPPTSPGSTAPSSSSALVSFTVFGHVRPAARRTHEHIHRPLVASVQANMVWLRAGGRSCSPDTAADPPSQCVHSARHRPSSLRSCCVAYRPAARRAHGRRYTDPWLVPRQSVRYEVCAERDDRVRPTPPPEPGPDHHPLRQSKAVGASTYSGCAVSQPPAERTGTLHRPLSALDANVVEECASDDRVARHRHRPPRSSFVAPSPTVQARPPRRPGRSSSGWRARRS